MDTFSLVGTKEIDNEGIFCLDIIICSEISNSRVSARGTEPLTHTCSTTIAYMRINSQGKWPPCTTGVLVLLKLCNRAVSDKYYRFIAHWWR